MPTPQSLPLETALACQHVERIVDALRNNSGGGWEGHYQGVIYWLTNASDILHVRKASQTCTKVRKLFLQQNPNSTFDLQDQHAPVIFAVVAALPKAAIVEKQVLLHTGQCLVDDDGDQVTHTMSPSVVQGTPILIHI